jgi:hypothetical protein
MNVRRRILDVPQTRDSEAVYWTSDKDPSNGSLTINASPGWVSRPIGRSVLIWKQEGLDGVADKISFGNKNVFEPLPRTSGMGPRRLVEHWTRVTQMTDAGSLKRCRIIKIEGLFVTLAESELKRNRL